MERSCDRVAHCLLDWSVSSLLIGGAIFFYSDVRVVVVGHTRHRKMVEGSNSRFYAQRPMESPTSSRHPVPLVDW